MAKYIQPRERGLFDTQERLEELSALGDPLARLDAVVDWSLFLPILKQLPRPEPKGPDGRPRSPTGHRLHGYIATSSVGGGSG